MIDYSLAKELKDAGFPVGADGDHIGNGDGTAESAVYAPTLSELIEAVGLEKEAPNQNTAEKKPVMHLFRLGWSGSEWFAGYDFYESFLDDGFGNPVDGWGATPEEAVARLWLAIHKQS